MASKTAIAGGLLSGLGEGLMTRAERKREEALARAKMIAKQQVRQEDRAFKREMAEEDRTFEREMASEKENRQRGLLYGTKTGPKGNVYGITRGGETMDLGIQERDKNEGGMSASDKRAYDMAVQRHTRETMDGKQTDWAAVAKTLRNQGHEDLARIAAPTDREQSRIDTDSNAWLDAKAQAEKEAEARNPIGPDILRGEATEEAYEGMTQPEWIERRAREIYRERAGQGGADADRAPRQTVQSTPQGGNQQRRRPQPRQQQSAGAKPPGQGTREAPYQATTQAQLDWFKTNAPAGAVIEVNGTLYTK